MEMEGHGGGHGLAFITSTTTPLWSTQWTPSTTGQYAGTCIFLIILAFIQRSIGAYRRRLESRWRAADVRRRYVTVAGQTSVEDEVKVRGEEAKLLTGKGVEENVRVLVSKGQGPMPWRVWKEVCRAGITTVTVGVGYLLMLAVMTYNVGYFMSVLGGVFLGELVWGRFGTIGWSDH